MSHALVEINSFFSVLRETSVFITHLSATLPRCARVLLMSNPFQLQMQASQPHFQLELCTPQLGELPVKICH